MTQVAQHWGGNSPDALRSVVHAHPLAAWVVQAQDELLVNHIPFLFDAQRGEHGTLVGHVARANSVWKLLPETAGVAVFQGPHMCAATPRFPNKPVQNETTPTWNYAVLHAHGIARCFDDRPQLHALVTRLASRHEVSPATPWQMGDAADEYFESMLNAVVGIEIPVQRWVDKWKVSQSHAASEPLGEVDARPTATTAITFLQAKPCTEMRELGRVRL